MKDEISKFSAKNLKEVKIVILPQNKRVANIFQEVFRTPIAAGVHFENSKKININVYRGDITKETSDAIVSTNDGHFELSKGMTSKSILRAGGRKIQDMVLQETSSNGFRITDSGDLPCGRIFHVESPNNGKDMRQKILAVLRKAEILEITSISFPALSTGGAGLRSSYVAKTMKEAFEEYKNQTSCCVTTMNVVIFDVSMMDDFRKELLGEQQSVQAHKNMTMRHSPDLPKLPTLPENSHQIMSADNKSQDDTFDIWFYSDDRGQIDKAIDLITQKLKERELVEMIENEDFERFSDWELFEVNEIAKKQNVEIKRDDKRKKHFEVKGLKNDVLKAEESMHYILRQFNAAEVTASFVSWKKYANGNWKDYHPRSTHILEKAYEKQKGDSADLNLNSISVPEFNGKEVKTSLVDLSNLEGKMGMPTIKRRLKSEVFPKSWDPNEGQVLLLSTSTEYKEIRRAFTSTGGRGTILSIERIQNRPLYKQFAAKRDEVKDTLSTGNPLERQLFHGTTVADKFILNGFDRSFAGKNATSYGVGVYFAKTAKYSHDYTSPDDNGQRRMFYADVITGDFCAGNSTYKAPPSKKGDLLYDSVVNNITDPTIFVVFKDSSAYPAYLIT